MSPPDVANLAFAFVAVMTAFYAAHHARPWICTASVFAGFLNLSQYVLHQG